MDEALSKITISNILILIPTFISVGTFVFGFISLYSMRKSERISRDYNLRTADYEKRRDLLLSFLSDYISLLDAHSITYMANTDEEYEGKDLDAYQHLNQIENLYYRIQLILNPENFCFEKFSKALTDSLELANKIRMENSLAELLTNSMRTPERALRVAGKALEYLNNEESYDTPSDMSTTVIDIEVDNKAALSYISQMLEQRDEHLEKYIEGVKKFKLIKEMVISCSREYLICEKNQLLNKQEGSIHAKATP